MSLLICGKSIIIHLLKKAIEKGDIINVIAEKPKLHSGEDTRWDFKVTIVFKNAKALLILILPSRIKSNCIPILKN